MSEDPNALYLIRKGAYYYRPNECGYTPSVDQAGHYTLEDAIRITHPNGPDGARDNMDYLPAPAVCRPPREEVSGEEVERVARAIAPGIWARFDNSTRPYVEGRGANQDGEQHWYALTYTAGCRSAADVRQWWTTCEPAAATWDVHEWRQSFEQARAAIAAMSPKPAEAASGAGEPVAWMVRRKGTNEVLWDEDDCIWHDRADADDCASHIVNHEAFPVYAHPPAADVAAIADLLTKAVGDITAALILVGKADKVDRWTAHYVQALNKFDAANPQEPSA